MAFHYKKIGPIIGGVVGGFWVILAAGIVWHIWTQGYTRKKPTRSLGLPYAAEPLRVEHKVTSWASTETNQPWVSQGNFLTSGSSVSQVCLTLAIVMPTINMPTLTFEADLRNETASFRAQSGRQSYEPRGPVPMGSQVFITTRPVTHDKYPDAYLRG